MNPLSGSFSSDAGRDFFSPILDRGVDRPVFMSIQPVRRTYFPGAGTVPPVCWTAAGAGKFLFKVNTSTSVMSTEGLT